MNFQRTKLKLCHMYNNKVLIPKDFMILIKETYKIINKIINIINNIKIQKKKTNNVKQNYNKI